MASGFDFSGIERDIKRAAQSAVDEYGRQLERELNSLSRVYRGQPIEKIKPLVRQAITKDGGRVSEQELAEYAQGVSDGETFNINVQKLRF